MEIIRANNSSIGANTGKRNYLPTTKECERLQSILQSAQERGKLTAHQAQNIMNRTMEFFYGGSVYDTPAGEYVIACDSVCGVRTLFPI